MGGRRRQRSSACRRRNRGDRRMNTPAQPVAGDVAAERRQTLEELYRAFNARDAEMFLDHMAPGAEWPNEATGGHVVGRAALRAHLEEEWRQGDPRIEPLQIDVDGEGARVRVDQLVRR